jgi:hypothetical protein
VYDRRYNDKVLAFEPSGALMDAALIMRDRETDSWWSIMTGDAIGGELEGTPLKELPLAVKMQWGEWKKRYPDTKVLSVDGKEHDPSDPYDRYFSSSEGFRKMTTADTRLFDKTSIYSFQIDGAAYAVPHATIEGGAVFKVDDGREVFLYREPGSSMFASTMAYVSDIKGKKSRFAKKSGRWRDRHTEAVFSGDAGFPAGDDGEERSAEEKTKTPRLSKLAGFDTFWYIWSTTHKNVVILE